MAWFGTNNWIVPFHLHHWIVFCWPRRFVYRWAGHRRAFLARARDQTWQTGEPKIENKHANPCAIYYRLFFIRTIFSWRFWSTYEEVTPYLTRWDLFPEIRVHLEVYHYDNYDNYIRERKVSAQIHYQACNYYVPIPGEQRHRAGWAVRVFSVIESLLFIQLVSSLKFLLNSI